jgi:transposase-like protein
LLRKSGYDDEFKRNAVELSCKSDKTVSQVGRGPGIGRNMLFSGGKSMQVTVIGPFPGMESGYAAPTWKRTTAASRKNWLTSGKSGMFQKSHGHLLQNTEMIHQFIREHTDEFRYGK